MEENEDHLLWLFRFTLRQYSVRIHDNRGRFLMTQLGVIGIGRKEPIGFFCRTAIVRPVRQQSALKNDYTKTHLPGGTLQ